MPFENRRPRKSLAGGSLCPACQAWGLGPARGPSGPEGPTCPRRPHVLRTGHARACTCRRRAEPGGGEAEARERGVGGARSCLFPSPHRRQGASVLLLRAELAECGRPGPVALRGLLRQGTPGSRDRPAAGDPIRRSVEVGTEWGQFHGRHRQMWGRVLAPSSLSPSGWFGNQRAARAPGAPPAPEGG